MALKGTQNNSVGAEITEISDCTLVDGWATLSDFRGGPACERGNCDLLWTVRDQICDHHCFYRIFQPFHEQNSVGDDRVDDRVDKIILKTLSIIFPVLEYHQGHPEPFAMSHG